jgi:hypothetical protein
MTNYTKPMGKHGDREMSYAIAEDVLIEHTRCYFRLRSLLSFIVIAMTLCVLGCDDRNCQFESDCPTGKACMAGECVRLCTESEQCAGENVCLEGRCIAPESIPACDGAACPDMGEEVDAGLILVDDSGVAMSPDANSSEDLDQGASQPRLEDDAGVFQRVDSGFMGVDFGMGAQSDGGVSSRGFDLTGLYTVASTVLVSTGGDFEEGREIRNIVALTRLNGTRYRIESYNLDGVREYLIPNVDFVAPEGAGRFQYEYTRRIPYRLNCDLVEVRFERGHYAAAPHGFQLQGSEERTYALDGENCMPSEYIVRTESAWVPLP